MTLGSKLARNEFVTEALRVTDDAIGQEEPTDQALRIIQALQGMRPSGRTNVASDRRVDDLERVQEAARAAWIRKHGPADAKDAPVGVEHDAPAGIDTPLGRLTATVWRRVWNGARHVGRPSWAAEYSLNGEPISVREIKVAGLARRPHSRNRQKKEAEK